jgi:hypothetical protein
MENLFTARYKGHKDLLTIEIELGEWGGKYGLSRRANG